MIKDYQLVAFQWTTLSITFCLVNLRLYFRIYLRRIWHWSDVFVSLAWLFSLAFSIQMTLLWRLGWLDNSVGPPSPETLALGKFQEGLKVNYAIGTMYFLALYLVKLSMLCFYDELINKHLMRKTWVALRLLAVLVVASWLFSVCEFLFYCKNISDNWSINPDNKCLGAGFDVRISGVMEAFHLLTDLLIYLFPTLVLRRLNLPKRQKVGVGILFFIGFITVANGFVYFSLSFFAPKAGLWADFAAVWEQTCSITIACCPAFKALIMTKVRPEFRHFWRHGRRFWRRCPEDGEGGANVVVRSPLSGQTQANHARRNNLDRKNGADDSGVALSDLSSIAHSKIQSKPTLSSLRSDMDVRGSPKLLCAQMFRIADQSMLTSPTICSPQMAYKAGNDAAEVPLSSINNGTRGEGLYVSEQLQRVGSKGSSKTDDSVRGKTFFLW